MTQNNRGKAQTTSLIRQVTDQKIPARLIWMYKTFKAGSVIDIFLPILLIFSAFFLRFWPPYWFVVGRGQPFRSFPFQPSSPAKMKQKHYNSK